MPLFGSRDVTSLLATSPTMPALDTDALILPGTRIMHVLHEIESGPMLDLLPPALHPTVPPTVSVWAWQVRGSDLGDFTLAQVTVGCRAGVRPRGFLVAAYCDDDGAAKALGERWGFRRDDGTPRLLVTHFGLTLTVEREGRTILDVRMESPEGIAGTDLQYVATMQLAHTPVGDRLVQVDPDYAFSKADRGTPRVDVFDAAALGDERIALAWPISASSAIADVTLPKLRYVCKVDVPAMAGTEPVL
jgi:hypothetical protein